MKKKFLALVLTLAMVLSLVPATALATDGMQEGNNQGPVEVTGSDKDNNLTMKKTVKPVPNEDGTYTVCLESYATGSVTTTQTPVPMDIVLVLDVSGSMGDKIASYDYRKTEKTSWSVSDVYHDYYDWGGWHRTDVTYYAKIDDEYYPVSYHESGNWGSESYWLEANNKVLGRKVTNREWNQKIYAEPLYTYSKVPGTEITKLYAMKTAVNSFIDSVAAQKNGDIPVAHRISIVKFADNGNIVKELTDVSHSAELKNAVNNLNANGATAADYGMQKAKDVLTSRENKENPSIVIMFTDGEPNHHSGYNKTVAGDTVQAAKGLKDGGTKVYTIGMFTGADPTDITHKFNIYMNGVSSNYPEAVKANNNSGVTLGKRAEGNYYFKADNAGELDQVFQTISQSTTTTSPLDDKAVVVDNVPSNFALTEGSVKVYTADCTGKDGEEFTWGANTPATITPSSTKNQDGSQTISTTGFNFSKNWCGLDSNNEATGKKLIIEFTIERTNYGGTQPTNAGAYIKAGKEENEKPIIKLDDPTVPVTISLGIPEAELNEKLGVSSQKEYDGSGIPILSELSAKANDLVDGINNAYVDMELTIAVDEANTYVYRIQAGKQSGDWYQNDQKVTSEVVNDVKTSQDVKRGQNNAVEPYIYNFDLKLSDATPKGAAPAEYENNTASFKITPKAVTVKANDQQVQKGTDPNSIPYTATVNGLVNGEQERLISRDIKCNTYTVDTPVTAAGSELEITATGAKEQGNYTVTYRPGKLTVVEALVTTGTLKVTKEVQGENLTLDNLPDGFKITVSGNGESKKLSLKDSGVNVNESKTEATWTISDLPAGEYTVSETGETLENYTCEATYHAGTASDATVTVNNTAQNQLATDAQASQQVTVTAGSERTMTVTNTYTKNATVNLSQLIQKQLTVKKDSELPTGTTFNVTVTPTTVNGANVADPQPIPGTVSDLGTGTTNGDGDTIYTASFDFTGGTLSLSAGTYTYTVQENATSPISGMKYDSEKYTLTIKVENSKASVQYTTKEGATSEVSTTKPLTIQNTYQTPNLSVTKQTVSVDGKEFDSNTVAHVGEQIVWAVSVINKKTTQASTQLKDTLGDVKVYKDGQEVTLRGDTWTATVPANDTVTYYVTYTVKADDIPKGEIVNTIVKDSDEDHPINSAPVSTWDSKQLKSATSLNTSNWTTTVKLTLPTVNGNKEGTPVITGDGGQEPEVTPIIAISKGSYVIDQIGNEFTFVPELTLKVGTTTYTGEKDGDTNTYNFGTKDGEEYPYTVTYTAKNDETKEPAQFTWNINEDVYAGTEVTLSYKLKLTNPKTAAGTYGKDDLDGSLRIPESEALYTNESAILYKKEGNTKLAEFPKPSVSYTIKGSSGGHGGNGGGTVTIPDDVPTGLNGKDHYAYVVGYPDGMVYPQKNITRAEVATIFFRLLEDETREANMTKSNGYNDMKDGAWYTCAVSTLSKMGIIKGYEDGSFKPDASISRAEFAAIAARFDPDGDKTPATFSDVSSHWAKDEISIAANHGWIKGYEDGSFKPDQKITRAETMTLVNRVLKRLPETKDDLHKDMKTWPDNQNESAWFYLAVQEATNSHYQKLKKDGTHETWESMRETRDWAALEK